jgi:hypothetical protein
MDHADRLAFHHSLDTLRAVDHDPAVRSRTRRRLEKLLSTRDLARSFRAWLDRDVPPLWDRQIEETLQLVTGYVYGSRVPGDIVEFGTMTGHSAQVLADAIRDCEALPLFAPAETRRLHLFDSFEGLPEATADPDRSSPMVRSGIWGTGRCQGLTPERLHSLCAERIGEQRVVIHQGWFSDTVVKLPPDTRFALIHFDGDLYQSTLDALDPLFREGWVSRGAALLFDDWDSNAAMPDHGERRAWSELVAAHEIAFSHMGPYGLGSHRFLIHDYRGSI